MTIPVKIVAAPFLALPRPALGPSLLCAVLKSRSIATQVHYLNIEYADFEDADFVQFISERTPTQQLLGEWVFSHLVYGPDNHLPMDRGLDWINEKANPQIADQLIAAKERAALFVSDIAATLLQGDPKIIGFSTSFQQNCASLAIAAEIKAIAPDVLICFGGANTEGSMGEALLDNYAQIDMVFSGESDHNFPDFVTEYLYDPKTDIEPRLRIGEPVSDMDALPTPDFSDYFRQLELSSFTERLKPALVLESSRGCWWGAKHHCTFCGLNGAGMHYRSKSSERVVDEITSLYNAWDIPRFAFSDNIMDIKHIEGVFTQHGNKLKDFRIFYEIKSNMSSKQLETLARGGVARIQPGIESLDDGVLKQMNKGVDTLRNILLLRSARELGVTVAWNILTGFPQERPEDLHGMAEMIPHIQHLDRPTGMGQIRIDRFSPYHNDPAGYGFKSHAPFPAYEHIYDLTDDQIERLAYFFMAEREDGLDIKEHWQPLRDAIATWQRRLFSPKGQARLTYSSLGPLKGIVDTRDIAIEDFHVLGDEEQAVLDAFETPVQAEATLDKLAQSWSHKVSPMDAYQELENLGYFVHHGGKTIHVVTDMDKRVVEPFGFGDEPMGSFVSQELLDKVKAIA